VAGTGQRDTLSLLFHTTPYKYLVLPPNTSSTFFITLNLKLSTTQTKLQTQTTTSQWRPSTTQPGTLLFLEAFDALQITDFLFSYVGDKANELTSGASKEANKNVAKDSDASIGTRASAAKDALGDKADETKNSVC